MGDEFFDEIELVTIPIVDPSPDRKPPVVEASPVASPVASPARELDEVDESPKKERVKIMEPLPLARIAACSTVSAGIQFGWALQLSLLTPYVQTLGIPHKWASIIWLCGPITGFLVQPCIGIWSDSCTYSWGRRRPFILAGVIIVCFAVTLIGFSADVGYFLGDWKVTAGGTRPYACAVFILGFWLLDLANNTVQGPSRALLADITVPEQRDIANAFCAGWMAVGNILGYAAGANGAWHRWFPFLSSKACGPPCANLKATFLISMVFLFLCSAVTLMAAPEKRWVPPVHVISSDTDDDDDDDLSLLTPPESPRSENTQKNTGSGGTCCHGPSAAPMPSLQSLHGSGRHSDTRRTRRRRRRDGYESISAEGGRGGLPEGPLLSLLSSLSAGIINFPLAMRGVLLVMALCWFAWFPFLLFDTDWMGREIYGGHPDGTPASAALYQAGVREGAFGLLLNSVVLGLFSLIVDPLCRRLGPKNVWAAANATVFLCMAATAVVTSSAVHLENENRKKMILAVPSDWAKGVAVAIFAVLGAPFAVTLSVPYSITGDLVADSDIGQGLAMGILNLAVVVPQVVVSLMAGPWDSAFGGGNEPAFLAAAFFALFGAIAAFFVLPRIEKQHHASSLPSYNHL